MLQAVKKEGLLQTLGKRCISAVTLTRFGGVFCVIKDQHITSRGLGGDDAGILGHVASSVHFSLVVDFDLNLDLSTHRPKASKL